LKRTPGDVEKRKMGNIWNNGKWEGRKELKREMVLVLPRRLCLPYPAPGSQQ
jgi:hypothetical protein